MNRIYDLIATSKEGRRRLAAARIRRNVLITLETGLADLEHEFISRRGEKKIKRDYVKGWNSPRIDPYNGNFRGQFAGLGMTYDPTLDEFVSPQTTEAPSE